MNVYIFGIGDTKLNNLTDVAFASAIVRYFPSWLVHTKIKAGGVRTITTGVTGLWQPSVHSDKICNIHTNPRIRNQYETSQLQFLSAVNEP